jgi:hypothetical protein
MARILIKSSLEVEDIKSRDVIHYSPFQLPNEPGVVYMRMRERGRGKYLRKLAQSLFLFIQ